MKTKLLFTVLFFYSLTTVSQVLYSDEFDGNINNSTSSSSLTTSLNNNNLRIFGNGTAGAWENIFYAFHNLETNISVDVSTNPKLYI